MISTKIGRRVNFFDKNQMNERLKKPMVIFVLIVLNADVSGNFVLSKVIILLYPLLNALKVENQMMASNTS